MDRLYRGLLIALVCCAGSALADPKKGAGTKQSSPTTASAKNSNERPCKFLPMDIVDPFCEWSAGTVEVTFQKGVERGKRVTLDSAQLSRGASYTFEKQLTYTTQFEQETDAQSEAQIPGGLIRAILSKKNKFVAGKTESVTRSLTVQGNECLGWDLFQQEVWQVGVARQTWTHKKTKEQRVTREPIRIMTHLTMIAQAKNCPKAASKTVETPVEANLVARGAGAEDQKARDETEVKPPT